MWPTWVQTDPLSGGAGWAGAGLLGLVLAWLLLKYLPDKDRQMTTLVEQNQQAMERQREIHAALEKAQRDEFRQTLEAMMVHSKTLVEGLGKALRADLQALRIATDALADMVDARVRGER